MRVLGLCWAACGVPDLVAIAPGEAGTRTAGILLRPPVGPSAWCATCWPSRPAAAARGDAP